MGKKVFKDSEKTDSQIKKESAAGSKKVMSVKKEKFKALRAFSALYPHGFRSTYQGVNVNIIFDGSEYLLSPAIKRFIENKIDQKSESSINKKASLANKKVNKLGDYIGG